MSGLMNGTWAWPSDSKQQETALHKVVQDHRLTAILEILGKNPGGLSNAQIDNLVANNSQWRTSWLMKELTALGLIEYKAELFGESGRYTLSEYGKTCYQALATNTNLGIKPS